jgi:hypothetical protein
MDPTIERQYFLEKIADFVAALEEHSGELHVTDDHRVLFRVSNRPFEAMTMIDEELDLICVTTRTADVSLTELPHAVKALQETMRICWEHCVAVSPISISPEQNRYDLSMAIIAGGFTFEAFEGVVYNLLSCAEEIEDVVKPKKKK